MEGSCRPLVRALQGPYMSHVGPLRETYKKSGTLQGRYMNTSATTSTTTTPTASITYTIT